MSATMMEERVNAGQNRRTKGRKTRGPRITASRDRRQLQANWSVANRPSQRTGKTVRVDPQPAAATGPHTPPAEPEPARPRTSWLAEFRNRKPLEKSFVMFGYVVALTLVLVFGSDLIAAWPFQRASVLFDAVSLVSGLALAYLSWHTYQDLR